MIVVDLEKCTGCGCCQMVCPDEALRTYGHVHIDAERCTDCGLCTKTCPMQALELSPKIVPKKLKKEVFNKDSYDVIIIGSGAGGLFSAARLSRLGYSVLVLERLMRLGGRKTTINHKGFQIVTGAMHYHMYGDYGPETQTMRELGLEWSPTPCTPHTIWRIGDKDYTMPEKGGMKYMFQLIGLSEKEQARLTDIFVQALRWIEPSNQTPFSEWLLQHSDNQALYAMYDAWIANISGYGAEHVSVGEFFTEMKHFGATPPTVIPGGNKGMIDALKGVIDQHEGEIHLRSDVKQIIIDDRQTKGVVVETESGKTLELKSRFVISNVGPKNTVELGERRHFESGFLREVDALRPAGDNIAIFYATDKPLFNTAGFLSFPYEFGGCQRISSIAQPSFVERQLDAPGKYGHYFWGLLKGEKEEEIRLCIEDMKNLFPKDFDEEKILVIQTFTSEYPSYRCIPGKGLGLKTSVENLYMVGDGSSPPGYIGGEACAMGAKLVAEDIQGRMKKGAR